MSNSMNFITLKEGAALINKSVITVRRIYKSAPVQYIKKEKNIVYIDRDYLIGHSVSSGNNKSTHGHDYDKTIQIMEKQIDTLNTRLNESNQIIMQQAKSLDSVKSLPAPEPIVKEIEVPVITEKIIKVKDSTSIISAFLYGMVAVIVCFGLMMFFLKG